MRILVTGATGNVGRPLVAQLHEAGHEVRALTRNPANAGFPPGVQAVAGDLSDTGTLEDAFHGVNAIHLITFGGDGYEDLTNGADIIALAERNGVQRATVLGGWSPTSIESALKSSNIDWTILQPREFMGNALEWADEIRTNHTVSMLATYPSAVVHEADIASVAVRALTEDGHGGRSYPLTGPEALTPEERARLRGYGYDDDYVEFGIQLATNPPDVAGVVLPTVENVTGRPARTFAVWAQENAEKFRTAL